MHNDTNATIDREPLGKGVFQPSRAQIARDMKARLSLGGSKQRERATGWRH